MNVFLMDSLVLKRTLDECFLKKEPQSSWKNPCGTLISKSVQYIKQKSVLTWHWAGGVFSSVTHYVVCPDFHLTES